MHTPPGTSGVAIGLVVPVVLWFVTYLTKEHDFYNLDPKGVQGAFEPFLSKYLKIMETVIGLASGSIVLLVGSSALRAQGRLPWYYSSPLFLLAFCALYGILFSVWLTFHYEDYQHNGKHSKKAYALCETLGFASLACFIGGYAWLIIVVTR